MTILGTVSLLKEEILIVIILTASWFPMPDNDSLWNQPYKNTKTKNSCQQQHYTKPAQVCLKTYVCE